MTSKVIIVTGASRGIGLAVVRSLLTKGAKVIGIARSPSSSLPPIKALLQQHPNEFEYIEGDLCLASVQDHAVSKAMDKFKRLDGVVFNAGVLKPIQKLADVDVAQFQEALNVNVVSIVGLAQKALPHLKQRNGKMVMVSSGAATNSYSGWGAYCTSKAALNMLCKCFALEEPEVTTIALRPGVVDTEMQGQIRDPKHADAMTAAKHESFVNLHKEGKLIQPEVTGNVISKLVLSAPQSLSGLFLNWDDEKVLLLRSEN